MNYFSASILLDDTEMANGLSVRCVKD
jgi:hypothetical protein